MLAGNRTYQTVEDLPDTIPVFPLGGALLLPGGQLPLNIFEPRYMAMFDHALAADRVIGIIQPRFDGDDRIVTHPASHEGRAPLCAVGCYGRITSLAETGDQRYIITLTGICRFRVLEELDVRTPYRQCRVQPFLGDLKEVEECATVNRDALLKAFRDYLDANQLEADWESVQRARNNTLVNALSMMSPFGPAEKQALLEAPDLRTRAETLIAITEVTLAREAGDDKPILQ